MHRSRAVFAKESLNHIERFRSQRLKQAEAKALGNRRIDAAESSLHALALKPSRAGIWKNTCARLGELDTRKPFGFFQPSR